MRHVLPGRAIHIYWFSGCGNTLLIAEELSRHLSELGREVRLLPMEKADPAAIDPSATLGIAVPVAGQGTYPLVWSFLKSLPRVNGTPCFLVDTLGLYSGGILGPVKGILKRKGFEPLAATEILMPNVFQKRKSEPQREELLTRAGIAKTREFCDAMVAGAARWADIPGYSWLMSLFYRSPRAVSSYRRLFPLLVDSGKCRRCGLCARLCPVGQVILVAGQGPVQGHSCILCQRCFAYCPSGAITIGKKETVSYHAVPLDRMLARLGR